MKGETKTQRIFLVILMIALACYAFYDLTQEFSSSRNPASEPNNYESMKACDKQNILWDRILNSSYKDKPDFRKFGLFQLIAMSAQEVSIKGKRQSDFAPSGWKKYIHGRGSIAKIKVIPKSEKYTGVFQGAECGLLRLSLTYKPKKSRPVAPGLALKILRDGIPSGNISALLSLAGQELDYNFFKNALSNIIPLSHEFGQKIVHRIFKKATKYPEEILANDLAQFDAHGETVQTVSSPRQIFFVPHSDLKFKSEEHDVRDDFATIPAGTTIYQIYAVPEKYESFNYVDDYSIEKIPQILSEAEPIADIVTTSEFVSSEFGDEGIFFRHSMR